MMGTLGISSAVRRRSSHGTANIRKGMSSGLYNLSGTALTNAATDIASMGATWVRFDFPWHDMEPSHGSYNTGAWDNAVAAANTAGLNILGIIDYTPDWANGSVGKFYPPTSASDYANFCTYLVNRYASLGVHTWEIWNEPNGGTFWLPGANPTAYTSLLSAAYTAIKAADSSATVITGGTATVGDSGTQQNCRTWLTNLYAAGAKNYFDAVGCHPYVYPNNPGLAAGDNWGQMQDSTPSLRSIMVANGDTAKKIWLTEFGYTTDTAANASLTESGQASYLTAEYTLQAGYAWAGPLFWYTYQDDPVEDPANPENWFGLVRSDGSHKSAYAAYAAI